MICIGCGNVIDIEVTATSIVKVALLYCVVVVVDPGFSTIKLAVQIGIHAMCGFVGIEAAVAVGVATDQQQVIHSSALNLIGNNDAIEECVAGIRDRNLITNNIADCINHTCRASAIHVSHCLCDGELWIRHENKVIDKRNSDFLITRSLNRD